MQTAGEIKGDANTAVKLFLKDCVKFYIWVNKRKGY